MELLDWPIFTNPELFPRIHAFSSTVYTTIQPTWNKIAHSFGLPSLTPPRTSSSKSYRFGWTEGTIVLFTAIWTLYFVERVRLQREWNRIHQRIPQRRAQATSSISDDEADADPRKEYLWKQCSRCSKHPIPSYEHGWVLWRCINCPKEREFILCNDCETILYPNMRYPNDNSNNSNSNSDGSIREDSHYDVNHPKTHVFMRIDFRINRERQNILGKYAYIFNNMKIEVLYIYI